MAGIIEPIKFKPSCFSTEGPDENLQYFENTKFTKTNKKTSKKCYTCTPRGTLKDHIISQSEDFVFNHDLFRRPLIIITSKIHYHTINELPDSIKLSLLLCILAFNFLCS